MPSVSPSSSPNADENVDTLEENEIIEIDKEVQVNAANFEQHLPPVASIVDQLWNDDGIIIDEADAVFVTPRSSLSAFPRTSLGSTSDNILLDPDVLREARPIMTSIFESPGHNEKKCDEEIPSAISMDISHTPTVVYIGTQEVLEKCSDAIVSDSTRPRRRRTTVANYNEENLSDTVGMQAEADTGVNVCGYSIGKTRKVKEDAADGKFILTTEKPKGKSTQLRYCLLYTSPSPRDLSTSRMPSSA